MQISSEWFIIINLGLIAIVVYQLIRGYHLGLVERLFALVSLVLTLIFSVELANYFNSMVNIFSITSENVSQNALNLVLNYIIWLVLSFIIIRIGFALIKPIILKIANFPIIRWVNKLAGLAFSTIMSWIILVFICLLLMTPLVKNGREVIQNTVLSYVQPTAFLITSQTKLEIEEYIALQRVIIEDALAEDIEKVKDLLAKNGFSEEAIKEFLSAKGYD